MSRFRPKPARFSRESGCDQAVAHHARRTVGRHRGAGRGSPRQRFQQRRRPHRRIAVRREPVQIKGVRGEPQGPRRFDRLVEDERQRDLVIVEVQPVHARQQRRPCGTQL
jgi:hypothetical protein